MVVQTQFRVSSIGIILCWEVRVCSYYTCKCSEFSGFHLPLTFGAAGKMPLGKGKRKRQTEKPRDPGPASDLRSGGTVTAKLCYQDCSLPTWSELYAPRGEGEVTEWLEVRPPHWLHTDCAIYSLDPHLRAEMCKSAPCVWAKCYFKCHVWLLFL